MIVPGGVDRELTSLTVYYLIETSVHGKHDSTSLELSMIAFESRVMNGYVSLLIKGHLIHGNAMEKDQ